MAYVYRHIRLDNNVPFYIGIGNDDSYSRAHNPWDRTLFWKNITSKTKYRVDIILDDLTWEKACKKEVEFISLYGRKDLNKGTLVNLTDGGEGAVNRNPQVQHNINKSKWKSILQYDLKGNFIKEWNSGIELQKMYSKSQVFNIQACCRNERNTSQGYFWYYKDSFTPDLIKINKSFKRNDKGVSKPQPKLRKKILVKSKDLSFEKTYSYIKECIKDLKFNVCEEVIRRKCANNQEYNDYIFSYLSPD